MTEKLQKTIKDEIAKLPKDAQDAINAFSAKGGPASGWDTVAEEIGKKYLLTESEINDLQVETLLVLVGLTDTQFYAVNIENQVGTTKDDAVKIADEVYQQILAPISNTMEENIKKNLKNKNPNVKQTLNFILSGGDYSAFIAPIQTSTPTKITPPSLAEIKANVQKTNI